MSRARPGIGGPLVDHDAGIGKSEALPGRSRPREIMAAADIPHAHADGGDVRLDVLHHVVDGHAGVGDAARGVDVEGDVLLVVLGLEEQHLRNDQVGNLVVDLLAQEDDALPGAAASRCRRRGSPRLPSSMTVGTRTWAGFGVGVCVGMAWRSSIFTVPRRGRAPGGAAERDPASLSGYIKCEIMETVSERRHPTVFPGFKEMAERRRSVTGQLVSLRREELGLSQSEVAARMGTSQSAVARFEASDLDVRLSTVERYTHALGARLEWRIRHG